MKKVIYLFIYLALILFVFSSGFAQYKKRVDGETIKKNITTLASDEYMGRETGTKGCVMTEDFFANQFKALKLQPIGDKNSYYYTYTISYYKVEGKPALQIEDRVFYYGRGEDFRLASFSDGGEINAEVVFAGYGINSTVNKRNDFENLDIKGKVVLARRGCPNNDWEKWKDDAIDSIKSEYCFKNGAVGLLLYEASQSSQIQMMPQQAQQYPNSLSATNQIKNFPVLLVDERVGRFILENTSQSMMNIYRNLDSKPVSCTTGKKAKISAKVTYESERKVRDVLAMIPGTDSKLKNEAIIIGGHIDHLGAEANGKINFGADDNASGPSVALGVAQAMVKNKFKPRRTIIFAGWSGEEKGLLGSYAWCKNPTWDLEKVVVYFNLDMVGLGDVKLNMPGIYYSADVWKYIKENTDTTYLNRVVPSKGGPGGSDHTPFLQKGVPAFAGMTPGSHPDYHTPGDVSEKISSDILQFVGDFMYHSIEILANSKDNFIVKGRNDSIRFQLANISNLSPVEYSNYKEKLGKKDLDFSLVNFSEKLSPGNTEQNFIAALKTLDEAYKTNSANKEFMFIQNPNEGRYLSYQGKSAVMSCIDLSLFGYDALYCKTIAKSGAKVGIIKTGASFLREGFDKNKTVGNLQDVNMLLLLSDPAVDEVLNLLKQAEKPVGIISQNLDILNNDLIQRMKSKGHVFIYKIQPNENTEAVIKNLEELKSKLGNDLVAFIQNEFDENGYSKIKDIYSKMEKKEYGGDFLNKVFNGNIISLITKAQVEKQQRSGGRPF